MRDKPRVKVQSTAPLVGLVKSKRLQAMRQSFEKIDKKEESDLPAIVNKKERDIYLAREVIRLKIVEIKASYPQSMQKKLFAIRYSSEEKINQMGLQQLFTLLDINQSIAKEIALLKYQEK